MTTGKNNHEFQRMMFMSALFLLTGLFAQAQSSVSVATGYNNASYSNSGTNYGASSKELQRKNDSLMSMLVADLKKDQLITDKKGFSFKLDSEGMKVNGEKQPEAIYNRYYKKYAPQNGKETNWSWSYYVAP